MNDTHSVFDKETDNIVFTGNAVQCDKYVTEANQVMAEHKMPECFRIKEN